MTDDPQILPPPPELIEAATGNVWTRLYPRPGELAVPLTAEQLGAVAAFERQRGRAVAPVYEMLRPEAATGVSSRVTPRIEVSIHGTGDGMDAGGQAWQPIPNAPGVLAVTLLHEEIAILADALSASARRHLEDDNRDIGRAVARRALFLQETLHGSAPRLTLQLGHPRWPGLEGTG